MSDQSYLNDVVTAANEYLDDAVQRRFGATGESPTASWRILSICSFQAGAKWQAARQQAEQGGGD